MKRMTQMLAIALLTAPAALVAQQPPVKPPVPAPAAAPKKMEKAEESEATLMKEAKIPEATARATALKEVPGGVVKEYELEREKGKLIWSYDIAVAGKSGIEEIAIDAMTGKMVGREHESAKNMQKEAAEDSAKAKAKTTGVKKP